jgi:hypothetical protein
MFRALLVHLQEALHNRHLVYGVRVISVGCTKIGVELQTWCSQLTLHTQFFCVAPPEGEQVMLETYSGPLCVIN